MYYCQIKYEKKTKKLENSLKRYGGSWFLLLLFFVAQNSRYSIFLVGLKYAMLRV